ncbi:MAG: hypothetical protein ISN28_09790 [Ectothiorhodospiraceae bacterium AqS1]|nr:hypothetical protein [Ectothiorhodospiraceae bacterium AqS1]
MRRVLTVFFAALSLLASPAWAFEEEILGPEEVGIDSGHGFEVAKSGSDGAPGIFEGQTDPIYISLSTQPTGTVTVTVTSSNTDVTLDTDLDTAGDQNTLTFTPSNWDTYRTVNLTAAEDDDRTGSTTTDKRESVTITMSASGADYDGVTATETLSVYDNDIIVVSPMVVTVDEGSSATFTVKLVQQPSRTINPLQYGAIVGGKPSELTYSPSDLSGYASFTFTTSNWNSEQTITVQAAEDDNTDDEEHRSYILNRLSSAPYYHTALSPLWVKIRDNDPHLETDRETVSMIEGGSGTFKVKLGTRPSGNVSVNLTQSGTANSDVSIAPPQLSFTTSNWNTEQTVTVSSSRDSDFDDDSATISLTASGGGYNNITDSVEVDIDDNEIITEFSRLDGASTGIFEGESDILYIKLSHRPSASVTVTLSSGNSDVTLDTDPDTSGNQNTLTFTTSNWNENQSVTLTAAEDDDSNGTDSDKRETATITISGAGAEYEGFTATKDIYIFDNDLIVVTPKQVTIDEGGSSATFSVSLARRPTAQVFVDNFIPSWWAGENDLIYYVRFTAADWNVSQDITVRAGEDSDSTDDRHRTLLVGRSSDRYYNRAVFPITTLVNDNDGPSLTIDPSSLEVEEGSQSTFDIKLAIEPTERVTVNLSASNSAISLSSTSLDFTLANWNVNQRVTVTAADDDDSADGTASINFTASGGNYAGHTDSLSVDIEDDDTPGLVLSADDLEVDEGDNETFTVRLATLPTGSVRVRLTQPTHTEVTVDTDTSTPSNQTDLNFTTSNWNTPQTVTVSAADDDDYADDPKTKITMAASGANYGDVTGEVEVTIVEKDTLGIHVWNSKNEDIDRKLSVDEGGNSFFMLRLTAKPPASLPKFVNFTQPQNTDVTLDAAERITGIQTSVTFNHENWNNLHKVTVSAAEDDDGIDDKATINIKLVDASPSRTERGTDSVAITVNDNDPIGIVLSNLIASNSLVITEGNSKKFGVKLATEPSEEVTISLAQSGTDNPDVSFSPDELTFTLSNWDDTQEVTVTAVVDSDLVNDGANIAVSASGGDYAGLSETVSVVVKETDDPAALVLSRTTLRISEGPGGNRSTGTVTVKLKSRPLDDVTVNVTEVDIPSQWHGVQQDVNISPTTLNFTTSNWDTAQTVTLTSGEDDDTADDDDAYIVFTAIGGDYTGETARMLLDVVDDDSLGHHINIPFASPTPIDEGTTVKWGFWLTFQPEPNGPVTGSFETDSSLVTIDHDPDTPGIQESTTFTSRNWLDEQKMTISVAEDDDAWDQRVRMNFRTKTDVMITNPQYPGSGQPYNALSWAKTLSLRDNDEVGLILSAKPLITEGRSAKFTVKLESLPWRQSNQANANVKLSLGPASNSYVTIDTDPGTAGKQTELTFTDQNWNVNQEVTVFAADEEELDDYSLKLPMSASGADYGGVTDSLDIDVQSNDIPGLVVIPSTQITAKENATATIRVKLTVPPATNVNVVATLPDDSDGLSFSSDSTVTFFPSNWNYDKPILVFVAADDNAVDESHSILLTASGGSGYYDDVTTRVTLKVDDSDPRGLVIPRNLVMDEGSTYSLSVALTTKPSGDVTVNVGEPTNSDVTRSPTALYFTVSNWNVPQTVTLTAARDGDDTNDTASMSLSVTGADYDGVTDSVSINITDGDSDGLSVTPTNLVVAEGKENEVQVVLKSQPSDGPVTVSVGEPTNSDVLRHPEDLTFTSSNWDTAQTVTVSAREDNDRTNDSAIISFSGGGLTGRVSVTVIDNEVPGLAISPARVSLDEGDSSRFMVELVTSETSISEDVSVTWPLQQTSGVLTYTPDRLLFTASNWNQRQEVRIVSLPDRNAVDESVSLRLSASGGSFDGVSGSLSIDITDKDTAGLTFSDSNLQTITSLTKNEDSSGSFTVRLNTKPSATVRVRLTQPANPDVIADVDTATAGIQTDLFFTTSNWEIPQVVNFTVAEDDDADNDSASIAFQASGGDYGGVSGSISISITDDDSVGLILSELTSADTTSKLTVSEGGNGTFKVRLATLPKNNVSVALTSAGTGLTLSPTTLSFTSLNWSAPQTVTVFAADDSDALDNDISVSLDASGGKYNSVSANVLVTVEDDDTESLEIDPTDPAMVEGGSNTITVRLKTRPSSNVTVALTQPAGGDLTFSPASLVFTSSDWDTTQTVTMTAGEDADVANDNVIVTLTASAGGYDGVSGTASVSIIDNDAAYIALSVTKLDLAEGAEGTFTMRLTKLPGSDVAITATTQPPNAAMTIDLDSETSGDQNALVFTTDDWSEVKTVNFTADHDNDILDNRVDIVLTASGGGYDNITSKVEVSVADDDVPGMTLSRTALRLNEGGGGSFTVVLEAQPSADTRVSISQSSNLDVRVSPVALTFTPADWDSEQQVTVTAAADNDAADETATISLSASGGGYDGIIGTVAVSVVDDDSQSIIITPADLTVFEGDKEDFIVKLATSPTSNVVVDLAQPSNDDLSLSPVRLSFTAKSWNQGQTVTISAAEDNDAESESGSVSLNASGGDYAGITGELAVRITDSDTPPALVLSPPILTATEGLAAKLKVKLLTRPDASVRVSVAPPKNPDVVIDTDTNTAGNQEDLIFTNLNWNTFQLVSVFAAKDDDAEDDIADLSLTASGGGYHSVAASVRVSVIDNSTTVAGLVLSSRDLTFDEGEGDRLMVRLATRPSADVRVDFARPSNPDVVIDTDDNAAGNQQELVFTPSDWNLARSVVVFAAQDHDVFDDRAHIFLTASGGDYSGITDNIAVSVMDNDTAPAVVLSPSESMTVTEGGNGIFTVRLATQPSDKVTLTLTQPPLDTVKIDTEPEKEGYQHRLFFTRTNWDRVQAVSVSAAEDSNDIDNETSISVYASGAEYANLGADLAIVAIEFDLALWLPVRSVIPAIPPASAHDTASIRIHCKEPHRACNVFLDCTAQDGTIYRGHLDSPIPAMGARAISPQGIADIVGGDWSGKGRLSCPLRSSRMISGQIWTRSGDGVLVNNSEILRSVEVEGVLGRTHHQADIQSIPAPGGANLSNIRIRCEGDTKCSDVVLNCYEDDGSLYSGYLGTIGRSYTKHLQTEELSSMIGHRWSGMGLSCELISDHPLSVQILTRTGGGGALVNNSAGGASGE